MANKNNMLPELYGKFSGDFAEFVQDFRISSIVRWDSGHHFRGIAAFLIKGLQKETAKSVGGFLFVIIIAGVY